MKFLHGAGAFVMAVSLMIACGPSVDLTVQAPATFPEEPGGFESATIDRVVDGDTLVVRITGRTDGPGAGEAAVGRTYRVRLIGIDTPESVDPRRPVECFGREAGSGHGRMIPPGTALRLVFDVERTDDFGRTLAYVYRQPDGLFVNAALVEQGYAQAATY